MNDMLKEKGYFSLFGNTYTFFKIWANKDGMTDQLWDQCVLEADQALKDNAAAHPELCEKLMLAIMDELGRIHREKEGKTGKKA